MNRGVSEPPVLTGFTHLSYLGGGGFADVFLYHQESLNRRVAVKVLLSDASIPAVRQQFNAEGNLMAALSNHPNIVSIYNAAISNDGRPYLVMEYCSRDNLSLRYREAPMAVVDVLAIGVQLAGAVETAHRAGIVHRDIKPANVLTTDYGRPALTDFGISVNSGVARGDDEVGLSIPWSPPEMLSEKAWGNEQSDVYSLAATVYSMLARRSPFELPGHSNGQVDLYNRIQRHPLPPVGRSDMPSSLEQVLRRGMSKQPEGRFSSALEFAHELQAIEDQLGFKSTQVDVLDEDPAAVRGAQQVDDGGRTRVQPLIIISPHAARPTGTPTTSSAHRVASANGSAGNALASRLRPLPEVADDPESDRTVIRRPARLPEWAAPAVNPRMSLQKPPEIAPAAAAVESVEPDVEPVAPGRSRLPKVVAAMVALGLVVGVAVILLTRGTTAAAPPADDGITVPTIPVAVSIPAAATDLRAVGTASGITFRWTNPSPQSGLYYKWQRSDPGADSTSQIVNEPTVTVTAAHACIRVYIVRSGGGETSPPSTELCANRG